MQTPPLPAGRTPAFVRLEKWSSGLEFCAAYARQLHP